MKHNWDVKILFMLRDIKLHEIYTNKFKSNENTFFKITDQLLFKTRFPLIKYPVMTSSSTAVSPWYFTASTDRHSTTHKDIT